MITSGEKLEAKTAPKTCPKCGGAKVAYIFYGIPDLTPGFERELCEGKVTIGGCVMTGCDPAWQCIECGAQIFKEEENPF